ncbi:MAG: hypothetical protein K8S00_00550 [Bacteroidales bacterium]|nr:hypothetical protein [Bacteroidales bacterium]
MNNLFPLRTIVGSSIPVKRIIPIQIGGRRTIKIETRIHENLEKTVYDWIENDNRSDLDRNYFNIYLKYLPDIIENGTVYNPMLGMPTLPGINSNVDSLSDFISTFLNNDSYKNPSDLPFPASDSVASLYGYQDDNFIELKKTDLYSNRDKEYSFLIGLEKEVLIGGICFQGYPYIPSRIENTPEGMTVGNFGLPREIRLTPLPSVDKTSSEQPVGFHRSQFIDSEYAYTRQEIISHSGLNYLTIDPVKTNLFLLTITDLPFIPKVIDLDTIPENPDRLDDSLLIKGFKGFAIPYLYFFEYKESTKRDARLHAGLMGVKSNATFSSTEDTSEIRLRKAFPEYKFNYKINGTDKSMYMLFTAHSALGQQRIFDSDIIPSMVPVGDKNYLKECYVSDVLEANENVTLFLQQGEEYERCIAGLKALFLLLPDDDETEKFAEMFANYSGVGVDDNELSVEERTFIERLMANLFHLPEKINFCERIGIKVYEIDSLAGMSPASIDLNSKYATLLADIAIDDFSDVIFSQFLKGIPFKRVSSSKYLAIELTNLGEESGQIAIHSLQMIRSAHVSVQPRPAKNQTIKAMHYRLIGAELADDFSALGNEGFNFSIDHQVAGQAKDVLYSANSLLDLLHTGGARIHSNVRRKAVEFEMVENFKETKDNDQEYEIKKFPEDNFLEPNFENRETDNHNISWRSAESGKKVNEWPSELEKGKPADFDKFESYSSNEIRTRTEQVSSIIDPVATSANKLQAKIRDLLLLLNTAIPINNGNLTWSTAADKIFRNDENDNLWKPFQNIGINPDELPIQGYQTLNIPPYYLEILDNIQELINLQKSISPSDIDISPDLQLKFQTYLIDDILAKLAMVNGVGVGFNFGGNVGVGLEVGVSMSAGLSSGCSASASSNLNAAMRSSTNGSLGTIQMSGQESKYSLNRSKQKGYDNNKTMTEFKEAEQKRIVTRRELLNRDNERIRGSEVMWQGKIQDIITGSVPLNITLPATATKMNYRTADNTIRVRFNSGFSSSVEVDFWFEIIEEGITDDF